MEQFDGIGARLNGDAQHYYPYGQNYDNEAARSTIDEQSR